MTRVVLIGDSIRMGYEPWVRQALLGMAEVWAPQENGGNSDNVLAHLDEWVAAGRPSVVHLNCGLHDIKKEFGHDEAAVPIGRYEANVRSVLQRLKAVPYVHTVWATTTPVDEGRHHAVKGFDRFETDVETYNAVACRVAAELGVAVNDLWTVVEQAGRERMLGPDGVHFTPEGYRRLGEAVAAFLRRYLTPVGCPA